MHVLEGLGPEESGTYFDHPYTGQLLLALVFNIVGYPDSLNPKPGDVHSVEMLYLVPRVLMGLLAVIDTFLVYKIADKRYNRKVAFIASILFAVMPMTWILRRILLDSILLPFLLTSILFALHRDVRKYPFDTVIGSKERSVNKNILILLSGIFLGLAIFTKIPVFTTIPLVAYLIYTNSNTMDKKGRLKTLGLWFIPVILIPAIWPAYNMLYGQYDDWKTGVFGQATRNNDGIVRVLGYFFKYDPVLLIVGTIGLGYAAIRKDQFALLWVIPFLLFLYFLNYGTYFYIIPVLPAFCIAAAKVMLDVPEKIERKLPISLLRYGLILVINVVGLLRARLKEVVNRITKKGKKQEEIQTTITSFVTKRNKPPRIHLNVPQMARRIPGFGIAYSSLFLFVVVAGIGLTSSIFLVSLDASWAQVQAAAFTGRYIEDRNSNNLTLVSSPVYSWISYYIYNNYQALKSFTNVPQDYIEYDDLILLADNHMRSSMKKKNAESLWSLYNDTTSVTQFKGRLINYDTRDYPYTNLLNMKEGAFIEIKKGAGIKLDPEDKKQKPDSGIQTKQVSDLPIEHDNLLMHIHTNLKVFKDGEALTVPANIGIDPKLHRDDSLLMYGPQKSPLHTHTNTGTIHVESKIITNYTLGEFLDVWGIDLGEKAVKVTVDDKRVSDYREHILKDGEHIHLFICSRVSSFDSSSC